MQIKKIESIFASVMNDACVAQLVEQLTLNQWVRSSNLRARTNNKKPPLVGGFLLLVTRAGENSG